jgi:methionyl-tRNA synthetase
VWIPDYLSRYDPDPLRYYLTINSPETKDSDFVWGDFLRRNNDELVATWGNLAHRALTFADRNFEGQVPSPGPLSQVDQAILARAEAAFESVGQLLAACRFRAALTEVMALAKEANRDLDEKAPWLAIKQDRQGTATSVYVALRVIDNLKTLFYPFLPFSSQRLHQMLGYDDDLLGQLVVKTFQEQTRAHTALCYQAEGLAGRWAPSQLPAGQKLREPAPLFKKLDDSIVEEERARLGRPR